MRVHRLDITYPADADRRRWPLERAFLTGPAAQRRKRWLEERGCYVTVHVSHSVIWPQSEHEADDYRVLYAHNEQLRERIEQLTAERYELLVALEAARARAELAERRLVQINGQRRRRF